MKVMNNIGWCDATTNAVTGCDKVSPGCKNCYAAVGTRARILRAQGKETWGAKGERVPVNFEPVFRRLNKLCVCGVCGEAHKWLDADGRLKGYQCVACGSFALRRIRLFADSNSDWLDPKWPVATLARFLDAIRRAPRVDVLLLTKRVENFTARLREAEDWHAANAPEPEDLCAWLYRWWKEGKPPVHVWLGVSVEDQKRADERIPALLKTPAAVRFLSCEPLLGPVDLKTSCPNCDGTGGVDSGGATPQGSPILVSCPRHEVGPVDWVIVGGESGKHRRDCGAEAISDLAMQCKTASVPCYVKQDCALLPGQQGRLIDALWARKEFPR